MKTKFKKENFVSDGPTLNYQLKRQNFHNQGIFIARIKYARGIVSKAEIIKQLVENHTVEDYTEALKEDTPIGILRKENPEWYAKLKSNFIKKAERQMDSLK